MKVQFTADSQVLSMECGWTCYKVQSAEADTSFEFARVGEVWRAYLQLHVIKDTYLYCMSAVSHASEKKAMRNSDSIIKHWFIL